ncbi:MAG: hypothetical protein ACKO5C_07675 [Ferruginibacter sp.]
MKKWILLFFLYGFSAQIMAQSLDEIKGVFMMNDFKKAKTMIDGFVQSTKKPKNASNAEAWYLSAQIHNYYSFDTTLPAVDALRLKEESFTSLEKYLQLDPSMKAMMEENGKVIFIQLYSALYNLGIGFFNDQTYDKATVAFIKANDAKNLSISQKLLFEEIEFSKLDTGLVINIGVSALNAKNEALAMSYFQQLADASLAGKDYLQYYVTLAEYYLEQKNKEKLMAISDKAQQLYPANADQFLDYEIKLLTDGKDETAKISIYKELLVKYPTNTYLLNQTALFMYKLQWESENAPAFSMNDMEMADRITDQIEAAVRYKAEDDPFSWNLMDRHLSKYLDGLLAITKNKKAPENARNAKSKYDLIFSKYILNLENYATYYEKMGTLKQDQSAMYKLILGKLKSAYDEKNDKAKSAAVTRKLAGLK